MNTKLLILTILLFFSMTLISCTNVEVGFFTVTPFVTAISNTELELKSVSPLNLTVTPIPSILITPPTLHSPTPVSTPTPTKTPTNPPTPTLTQTEISAQTVGKVNTNGNCYHRPDSGSESVQFFDAGNQVQINGRNNESTWLYISDDNLAINCWMDSSLLSVSGDLSRLPEIPEILPPKPKITHATLRVINHIVGSGGSGEGEIQYGFEVDFRGSGDFETFGPENIYLIADSQVLPIQSTIVHSINDMKFLALMNTSDYPGPPILGEYKVSIRDRYNQLSNEYFIGVLKDIPKDAPEFIFPKHNQSIAEKEPLIQWESFRSEYNGRMYDPEVIGIGLNIRGGERFQYSPIPGNETSISYSSLNWFPTSPPILQPGNYELNIGSTYVIDANIQIEHRRSILFEVLED